MKNWKSSGLTLTPLAIIIVVAAAVLGVELLFMALLQEFLMPMFELPGLTWGFIDAVALAAAIAPLLYFLVFRKIHDSEERFRQFYALAPNAVVIVDEQGRITEWNPAAQKMFQYSREEAVGQLMHQLIAPPRYRDDAARGFARFGEIGAGPLIGKTTEVAALRKDGSEFPVELSISAARLQGHWHAIGIIHDLTERKQVERREHLEKIRLKTSLQLDSMVVADDKAILDFVLEEGIRMTDSRYAFIGWINEDASVMTIHSWSREVMEACAVEQPPIEFPIDKAGIWAEPVRNRQAIIINDYAQPQPQKHGYPPGHVAIRRYLGVPVFDGERVAMIAAVANKNQGYDESDVAALSGVMTDAWRVIQRNRAERELRESEERFSHLFSNMSSAVAIYQPDAACETFTFKSVNHALERIERVKCEEVLGRSVEDVFPGVRAFGLLEVFKRVCRSGEPEYFPPAFYRDERISGWRENHVYRLESGEVVAVYDDVTERTQAEQKRLEADILLKNALEDAIGAIAATLEQRDPYTAGHQRRVAQLAAVIAEEMGLAREVIEGIHFGGLIHDLGKISVPAEILGKPGRLTDIELGIIKIHAEAGYRIVKDIAFPWPVADMVRQHHERLDGSGYPQGLKGDEIVLEARILAVADVVEAMSANRPYRPGLGIDAALEEITRVRGTQLDARAVDACLRVIREKGFVFVK